MDTMIKKLGAVLGGLALLISNAGCTGAGAHDVAASAAPDHALHNNNPPQRVQILLVGDSTMATSSGYGDQFCAAFSAAVSCLNAARGGRSSASYRAEGLWEKVMETLRKGDQAEKIVLIQFGHNDQPGKPGRSTDLATEFPRNLEQYVLDVKHAGGTPILVTPLTRRTFVGGVLENNLRPWAQSAIDVAAHQHIEVIDLNFISSQGVQKMGQAEADTLAMAPPPEKTPTPVDTKQTEKQGAAKSAFDRTHVGKKGAALFSAMVLQELVKLHPELVAMTSTKGQP